MLRGPRFCFKRVSFLFSLFLLESFDLANEMVTLYHSLRFARSNTGQAPTSRAQ